MRSKNFVFLTGRLGNAAEIKQTQNGKSIITFNLATSEVRNQKEATEWHRIVTHNEAAGVLKKGEEVTVIGKIQNRSWTTQTGEKKYITEIYGEGVFKSMENGAKEVKEETQPRNNYQEQESNNPW